MYEKSTRYLQSMFQTHHNFKTIACLSNQPIKQIIFLFPNNNYAESNYNIA